MKRSISLLSAFAFVLAFSGSVYGQSENISATAEVVTPLTTNVPEGVDFGIIAGDLSTAPILDLSDGSTSGTSGSGSFGYVQVTNGQSDQDVIVNFNNGDATTDLGDGNNNLITWTLNVGTLDGNVTSVPGGGVDGTITDGATVTLDNSGQKTIVFGGELTSVSPDDGSSSVPSGTYTSNDGDGDVSVSFDYSF